MKHYTMRWTLLKVAVRFVVIMFVVVTGMTAIMYLNTPTSSSTQNTIPMQSTTQIDTLDSEPLDIFSGLMIDDQYDNTVMTGVSVSTWE